MKIKVEHEVSPEKKLALTMEIFGKEHLPVSHSQG